MKLVLSLIISFLFTTFITKLSLAFSNDVEEVLDTSGIPLSPRGKYYILPAIWGPDASAGGGVRLAKTGDSNCPVTVLQDYLKFVNGIPVKFTITDISTGIISTGTPLEIEFTNKPDCAESSKWFVFRDNVIQKACVGIGGSENYPGTQTLHGTFNIQKYKLGYKLRFCITGSPTCLDIGRFDNSEGGFDSSEGGRRLNLTEHEPFEVVFVEANSYEEGIIKSVV